MPCVGSCYADANAVVLQLVPPGGMVVAVKYGPWQPHATSIQARAFLWVAAVVIME